MGFSAVFVYLVISIIHIVNFHFGGCTTLPLKKYPAFGRSMMKEFFMESDFIQLNHGAFGTYPKVVSAALREFQERSERNPDLWLRRDAKKELDNVRALLASLIHADSDDIVMVPNTTSGISAILRSLVFPMGSRILHMSTVFHSVDKLIQFVIDYSGGNVSRLVFNANYPISNEVLLSQFLAFLNESHDAHRPIKLAVIDHISSMPGVVLPIEKIIPILKQYSIPVLVDAAHAIGQVPINITALKPDYYVTNCHKWLFAPRGCALIYVDKRHQGYIHPLQITFTYKQPAAFQSEFFWTGTMDYTPYMTIPTALQFREDIGGQDLIMEYTHNLVHEGGTLIARHLGTEVLQSKDQMASMVDVRLPLDVPDHPKLDSKFWVDLQLDSFPQTFVLIHKHNGHWWARISAQIYNDLSDFEYAAQHLKNISHVVNFNTTSSKEN